MIGLLCCSTLGCTSLTSTKLSSQTNSPSGLTYRLPAKQFSITATYQVTGCQPDGANARLEANVVASFTESLVGAEAYTIDYQQLNAWTKVTNTEFQLSEAGLLMGVNASIEDKSSAVVQNASTSIAGMARATALSALGMPDVANLRQVLNSFDIDRASAPELLKALDEVSPDLKRQAVERVSRGDDLRTIKEMVKSEADPCHPVNEALEALRETEDALKVEAKKDKQRANATSAIRDAETQIAALQSLADLYEKLGDNEEKIGFLKKIQIEEKAKEEAKARLKVLGDSQTEKLTAEIGKVKSKLSVVGRRDFVPSAGTESATIDLATSDLERLLDGRLDVKTIRLPVVQMTVRSQTARCDAKSDEARCEQLQPDDSKLGIAYRVPVAAIASLTCECGNGPAMSRSVIVEKITQVPQYGPIGSINLKNVMFDDNLIELAFNSATGAPSKLVFRAKSKADAASASARDAAGTYLQLQKDKRDDQIAANKYQLDQATNLIALDKANTELGLTKTQTAVSESVAKAEMQQALVTSKLQLLRDQQRLDAVRTGTATAAEVELEALVTQEQLLAQRLKILKLQQEISEQQAQVAPSGTP